MADRVSQHQLFPIAHALLRPAFTVLDIGPGIRPQTLMPAAVHICVEPYEPYAQVIVAEHPGYVVLNCTWAEAIERLLPDSVDTVFLLDVIEHLDKDAGRALLDATIPLARSQVVVQTPLGFMPQGEDEELDAWGMGGVDWQIHRSGWTPEDFPGWEIVACERFHSSDAYGRPIDPPHGAFFAILDKGPGHWPEALNDAIATLKSENETLRSSTSWRITRPLRWLGDRLARG